MVADDFGSQGELLWEAEHSSMRLTLPIEGVVVVVISGTDVGESGDTPFTALGQVLHRGPVELFIDARDARGVSLDVSRAWAAWLREHRDSLARVVMLARSRFVELTATFVRSFAGMDDQMQVHTDPAAFDTELERALGRAASRLG